MNYAYNIWRQNIHHCKHVPLLPPSLQAYLAVEVVDGLVAAILDLVQGTKAHVGLVHVAQRERRIASLAHKGRLIQHHLDNVAIL